MLMTKDKWEQLQKLWFVYGNHGKKHTHGNHKFIQDLMTCSVDESQEVFDQFESGMKLYSQVSSRRVPRYGQLTEECVNKVREIMTGGLD